MKKISAIIIIVIIAAYFYSERYMYVGGGDENSSAYVMNKWTGKIYRVGTGETGLIGKSSLGGI